MIDLSQYIRSLADLFAGSQTLLDEVGADQSIVRDQHIVEDLYWFENSQLPTIHQACPLVILRETELGIQADTLNAGNRIGGISSGEIQFQLVRAAKNPGRVENAAYRESKRDYMRWVSSLIYDLIEGAGRESTIGYRQLAMLESAAKMDPATTDPKVDVWMSTWSWRFGGDTS